ncbi:MAG: porin family protein [Arcicella sp.]|nr:porin family protein [Arcicella sp.]
MKKQLFILLAILLIGKSNESQAQFTIGIKGGVNLAQLKTDFKSQSVSELWKQSLDTKLGYAGGIYARIGSKLFLQPELIFSAKGGSLNILPSNGSSEKTIAIDYTNLDVPLLIGYKFGPIRINGGPMASFKLSSDATSEELKTYSSNVGDSFKNAAYGYQVGGGIDVGSLSVDVRYEGSLSEVTVVDLTNKVNFSQKGNLWQVTLGLKLF